MKVVITGGAGYIGAAVTEQLSFLQETEEIRIIDNLSRGNYDFFFQTHLNKEKIKFTEGDILETRKIAKILKGADVLIHLASSDISASDNHSQHQLEQVNHWGTAELSYAIENSELKKVIHLSTYEVYGFSHEAKTESSVTAPETPYALSKLRGEQQISRLKDKLPVYIFRPGVVAGHSAVKNVNGVANKMIFDALIRKRVSIHGDGKQKRPVLSISNLVKAIIGAVAGQVQPGLYNLFQNNISVLDTLDQVKTVLPDTEFIFTNHHFTLPEIIMGTDFQGVFSAEELSLQSEYEQILKYFRI